MCRISIAAKKHKVDAGFRCDSGKSFLFVEDIKKSLVQRAIRTAHRAVAPNFARGLVAFAGTSLCLFRPTVWSQYQFLGLLRNTDNPERDCLCYPVPSIYFSRKTLNFTYSQWRYNSLPASNSSWVFTVATFP